MYLVLLAGALAVLGERLQGLSDQVDVRFVDVEAQQAQASGGASTHDVQELKSLTHQVVVGLIVLAAQEVLETHTYKVILPRHTRAVLPLYAGTTSC